MTLVFAYFPVLATTDLTKPLTVCRTIPADEILAASDDALIVRRGRTVVAIESGTLNELWRTETTNMDNVVVMNGGELFLTVTTEQSRVSVISISLATGLDLWHSAPTAPQRLVAAEAGLVLLKDESGRITALDRRNGNPVWTFETRGPILTVLADDGFLTVGTKGVARLSAVGKIASSIQFDAGTAVAAATDSNSFVFGYADGSLTSFDAAGRRRWNYKLGGRVSFLLGSPRGIIAGSFDNFVYLFEASTGRQIWKKRVGGRIIERPLIAGEHVAVADSGSDGVTIVELRTGRTVNQIAIGEDHFINGAIRFFAGRLVVPTDAGALIIGQDCK